MPILINAYSTLRRPTPIEFPHKLHGMRDRSDPELTPHLDGFVGYVMNVDGNQMTKRAYHVMRHIQRVQWQYSFEVADRDLDAASKWAWKANAILFLPNGSICAPSGVPLLPVKDDGGLAEVPYPDDAFERKERSDELLAAWGIHVAPSLPLVIGEGEVDFRPAEAVARRCCALVVAAVRGESLASNNPIDLERLIADFPLAEFSPKELRFLHEAQPSSEDAIAFAWRYEALSLLEWVLGLASDLPHPTQICNVPVTVRTMVNNRSIEHIRSARLRPAAEILDALDLHYRLHWACVDARLKGQEPPGNLDQGVIVERRRALNWLVRFEYADWDNVDTPT